MKRNRKGGMKRMRKILERESLIDELLDKRKSHYIDGNIPSKKIHKTATNRRNALFERLSYNKDIVEEIIDEYQREYDSCELHQKPLWMWCCSEYTVHDLRCIDPDTCWLNPILILILIASEAPQSFFSTATECTTSLNHFSMQQSTCSPTNPAIILIETVTANSGEDEIIIYFLAFFPRHFSFNLHKKLNQGMPSLQHLLHLHPLRRAQK